MRTRRRRSSRFPLPNNNCEKLNSCCLSHSEERGSRPRRHTPATRCSAPLRSALGPDTQALFTGRPFAMPDLCPCCRRGDICAAPGGGGGILARNAFPSFSCFPSVPVIKSNRGDTSHLFFPSSLQPFVPRFLPRRRRPGERIGADLRVYISVVPPPHCGIDVALWGQRSKAADRRTKRLKR